MPRSFDIARKPKHRPAPETSYSPAPTPKKGRSRKKGGLVFFVFVVGVLIIGFSFNSMSKKPLVKNAFTTKQKPIARQNTTKKASGTKKPSENGTDGTTTSSTRTEEPSTTTKESVTTPLKIQILNGTGIETITDQVKKKLEENKFPVESTSKAQFEYGQTYIYYRPNAVEQAKKISEILSPYKPTLSESQISGLFDILIIMGKQNLPPAQ